MVKLSVFNALKKELGIQQSLAHCVNNRQTPDVEFYCAAAYRMYTIRDGPSNQDIRSLNPVLNSIGPHRSVTNPRDYIYAYLSFLEDRDRSSIQVDYKKPPQALYQEIVTSIPKSDEKDSLVIY
ncbi:putative Heterokaryon incompatibility domain-containing protein [Seiridium cardinale]|uniref:Heterokaryon incompatibility domain-containing protein n=1 Tax=Seiridium cardinale TaxID=138064 RepID=A0ABR2Y9N0_9PEZI